MLINCTVYRNGYKLKDVAIADISDYMRQPDCFVWVALKDPSHEQLAEMQEEFGLHELAVEDAHHGHQRPKIEEYEGSLFVVMHLIEMVQGELNVGEVDVFVGKNYVLSVRNNSQQGFLGVRERCEREPEQLKQGAAFVLYALMDAVVDRYFPILDELETELEIIEEQIFVHGSQRDNMERLYELKRKTTVLKHAVAPLIEAASRLYGVRMPSMLIDTQAYFRDVVDHLLRINTSIDAMRDTIGTAIQVNLAMVAIEESIINKRLAAWAAIFAVATAFAGIWGMNFAGMPELEWKYGYPMALGMMFSACFYLYRRFRKTGWL